MALDGLRVGVTARRKGAELAQALARRGAQVHHGPTLAGDVPVPDEEVVAATDAVTAAGPAWLVASTGVGVRRWVEVADAHGRGEALRSTAASARCVARGPKAVGGLAALDVRPVWTAPEQTDAAVAAWVAAAVAPGDVVAVQLHGSADLAPFAPVADAGARLSAVVTYRHALPDDLAPARGLIDAIVAGDLDVVTVTSPGAVRNLFAIAEADGRADALRTALTEQVAVAAIGPVTGGAVEQLGVPVALAPTRWRTGDLLRTLDGWAATR